VHDVVFHLQPREPRSENHPRCCVRRAPLRMVVDRDGTQCANRSHSGLRAHLTEKGACDARFHNGCGAVESARVQIRERERPRRRQRPEMLYTESAQPDGTTYSMEGDNACVHPALATICPSERLRGVGTGALHKRAADKPAERTTVYIGARRTRVMPPAAPFHACFAC
jgi:hypothetical protein